MDLPDAGPAAPVARPVFVTNPYYFLHPKNGKQGSAKTIRYHPENGTRQLTDPTAAAGRFAGANPEQQEENLPHI